MTDVLQEANLDSAQPLQVLEIGCGGAKRKWAKYCGGLLFQAPLTEYVGVDPVVEVLGPANSEVIAADCTDLPFDDRAFDVVMMRSLFGQFTDDAMLRGLYDVAHMGLMEAYRVLRPGGEVVVAEENTPWDAQDIEDLLVGWGFQVNAFEYMSEDHWSKVSSDSPWLRLRAKYYTDEPTQRSKWVSQGDSPPYVMTAIKPENTEEISERVHRGFDPETGEDLFTDKLYVHGKPIAAAPLTTDKFSATYQ